MHGRRTLGLSPTTLAVLGSTTDDPATTDLEDVSVAALLKEQVLLLRKLTKQYNNIRHLHLVNDSFELMPGQYHSYRVIVNSGEVVIQMPDDPTSFNINLPVGQYESVAVDGLIDAHLTFQVDNAFIILTY